MHHTLILKEKNTFWQDPQIIMDYVENELQKYDELENVVVYLKE